MRANKLCAPRRADWGAPSRLRCHRTMSASALHDDDDSYRRLVKGNSARRSRSTWGGKMRAVRFGIVEGEPGIFPDPIARLLRLLGTAFRREQQKDRTAPAEQEQQPDENPGISST